ncbi:hypothetical protein BU26DRAFT_222640 [Trematosphaeria pertusa]|uniref:Uncharacterized protein n=1 Tax=Trematosphaeria pertusa TaxID=390896 RepID=A0A6A6IW47_9PLEO|nr:uncharacterized protein BU26DRAFT_222640 [Trematosphaeria pertusa]KAF2253423.1 hypothetical protein BU26DRAFT_222640 [Trematosphaeria pertusa]
MAKKNKKKQKQVDWSSPPPSPKTVPEEPVPALPGSLPLSPETAATESTQGDPAQPLASPIEAKIDDKAVEEFIADLATNEATTVEELPTAEQKQEETTPLKEEEKTEAAPEATLSSSTEAESSKELEQANAEDPILDPAAALQKAKEDAPEQETPVPLEPVSAELEQPEKKEEAPAPELQSTESVEKGTQPEPQEPTQEVVEATPAPEAEAPPTVAEPAPEPEVDSKVELTPEPEATKQPEEVLEKSPEPKPEPIEAKSPPLPKAVSPLPAAVALEAAPSSPRSVVTERPPATSTQPKSPPKPEAVSQAAEDSRPPAPTPPVTRARPRHSSAFDDDDEDDSALIQPRLRSEALSRDSSRGSTYPPPTHSRSLFASRVPAEHYPNPQPPHPPPGYHHPRYYPPAAPPYYHNHTHSMSQSGGYPNHSPYGPPSHASSPYQETWGPTYGPYGSHSPPQRHDSMGSRDFPPMGPPPIENGSAIEDDSGDIFSRIAQAIPDLHVLLARYKETHGQLGVREELLRRAGIEQQEKLRVKDEEINSLRERLANMEHKHSTEAGRLRLEIGNMEEQVKELKEQSAETDKYKREAEEARLALDAAMKSWETKYKELDEAHAALEKTSAEEIAKAQKEFEDWKSTANTKHDAEKIALAIQFDKKLKEADVMAENQRQEAAAAFVKEKDELRSEHQRQQREREASFEAVRKELEIKLGAAQLDREEAHKREREGMEVWTKERGTLVQAHREDIESLRKSWDEQRALLEAQHKKIKDESDKAWIELHAEANRKAEEEKARADQLAKDKDELQKQYNELKADNEKEKEVIKSVASNLESEKSRLEKLMECYGDIAEIKSKGDTYYLVSFTQLQKQILDLATTHFVHLPVAPPPEDLALIPTTLPSFLGDTTASRQLRSAYVAHTVSKLVTYRVFGPFLFSLGRRYDKADSLFSSMSNHIRDKSSRKEAIWRQQTLLAAFTSSGAKQRINTAAGTVVEEIVNAIKHFADPREEEGIKIAVKRIIKLAAETWRFARLEREMITATMPALQDEEHQFTGPEYWPAYRPEGTPIASLAGTAPPSDDAPKLLLRLFPVIYREPKHEHLRSSDEEKPDEGCVYHHGLALYDDAEPVAQRAEELKAAAPGARA